jgi:FtsP/CotA-like multicopper oxidase with cupredoxin domain
VGPIVTSARRATPLLAVFVLACGTDVVVIASEPSLTVAADENPDPSVVEVSLVAGEASYRYLDGPMTAVWAYNGSIPGPLIEARTGDELVVHFENQLPDETTIHWHGLRLPAAMDGTLAMQSPIPPGGTFEYRFVLRDAGLFWFHPHIRSDVQIEKGLYGVMRVRGDDEPLTDAERIVVLDDVRVLPDGSLPTYLDDESKMLGRQGNILLVNGAQMPSFRWAAGSLQRLRIVNVANGRFFNLRLPGYSWRVIGTDGGLVPQPYDTEHLLLSPGERYDVVLVVTGEPGDTVTLVNDPYERGHDTGEEPALPLAKFVVSDDPALMGRVAPRSFAAIERLPDVTTEHEMVLNEGLIDGELAFTINGQTYPDVPSFRLAAGDVRRLRVRNESGMDHPFHLHGTFFQVLRSNGADVPAAALANKDTIIVPKLSELELVSRFDEPGRWMYHCHILEHAEGGMMGEILVSDEP